MPSSGLLMLTLYISAAETSVGRMCICFVADLFFFITTFTPPLKKEMEAIATLRDSFAYHLATHERFKDGRKQQ